MADCRDRLLWDRDMRAGGPGRVHQSHPLQSVDQGQHGLESRLEMFICFSDINMKYKVAVAVQETQILGPVAVSADHIISKPGPSADDNYVLF